jgi:CDGSH-type Zn-finger protein
MVNGGKKPRIKIVKDGPYLVSGSVPLTEKIIVQKGKCNEYHQGRELPVAETYALCRCGKSQNAPFCDGAHAKAGFDGTETASKAAYVDRATLQEGPNLDLMDDRRCAFARFCHREEGLVWDLIAASDNSHYRSEAIEAASDCPTGRLVARDKDGHPFEPAFEPSIDILQDPQKRVSGPLFVKGRIPIESADGSEYEVRNRVALCRCGESDNIPFCDAAHVVVHFQDKK